MIVELINTGTELMLGSVLNTHQQWLCRQLAQQGCIVRRQLGVADTAEDIGQAVRESLTRADLVITTGGLGPTSDDRTRDVIAQLLARPLQEDRAIVTHLENFFALRRRPMPVRTRVQALVPVGATVFENPHGTAPGLALEVNPSPFRGTAAASWLVMLPGPPRELHPMFLNSVMPWIRRTWPREVDFACRTLRTIGIGESVVEERIGALLTPLVSKGLEVGYCARVWQVDVRLSATGSDARSLVNEAEAIVRDQMGDFVFADTDDELETVVVRMLAERQFTLALAESCTGGSVANRITNVPGASAVFLAGFVSYSNPAKKELLGVREETLAVHGAVSEPVAREMAEGARLRTRSAFAISVTGIAGPDGGSPEKPVGTVFIGLASPKDTVVEKAFNPYDRETFKIATANQALEKLRRTLLATR